MGQVPTRSLSDEERLLLQREEKSILAEIVRICGKHNIRYYIVGGTLLGAVRHGGFIPWDDDIDIAMYREDFKKFVEICKTDLSEQFFLQTYYTDRGYYQLIPKIRKNNTLLGEKTSRIKMHRGAFVDIFMLDYADSLDWKVKAKHSFHWFMINLFMRKQLHNIKNPIKRFFVNLIPARFIVGLDDKVLSRKKVGKYTVNYSSMYGFKKQTIPSDYYGEGVDIKFDDLTVKAPNEYVKILESIYGDYMQLPPVEKRGLHHRMSKFQILDDCNKNENKAESDQ